MSPFSEIAMLPALILVVASYATLGYIRTLSDTNARSVVKVAAGLLLLLSFTACSVVTFAGAADELAAARERRMQAP